jgi:hypothetical protein
MLDPTATPAARPTNQITPVPSQEVRHDRSRRSHTPRPEHPVVTRLRERRSTDVQLKLADATTRFAGSMGFVYVHAVAFAIWMLYLEASPWPTLPAHPAHRGGRQGAHIQTGAPSAHCVPGNAPSRLDLYKQRTEKER